MESINYSVDRIAQGYNAYTQEVLTFAGAGTALKGTIIARNTSTLKLQVYAKGGSTAGNGVPIGILDEDVVATGAGDVACTPIRTGIVDSTLLIIDADGDGSNIDNTVLDLLFQVGLEPKAFTQNAVYGNQ